MIEVQELSRTCTGNYLSNLYGPKHKQEFRLKRIINRYRLFGRAHLIVTTTNSQKIANELLEKYRFIQLPWSKSRSNSSKTCVWVLRLQHIPDEVEALLKE